MRITRTAMENIILNMAGRNEGGNTMPEARLHAAVIAQALLDSATSAGAAARRSLLTPGEAPVSVSLLGLEDDAVRDLARRFISYSEGRRGPIGVTK